MEPLPRGDGSSELVDTTATLLRSRSSLRLMRPTAKVAASVALATFLSDRSRLTKLAVTCKEHALPPPPTHATEIRAHLCSAGEQGVRADSRIHSRRLAGLGKHRDQT